MEQFKAIPKRWGNSLGVTIPSEVVEREHIQPQKKITVLVIGGQQKKLKQMAGTLKLKRSIEEMMNEVDEGYDEP